MQSYLKAIRGIILWPLVCKNWYIGFLSFLGLIDINKRIVYKMRDGLRLVASGNKSDFQVIREHFVHKTYINGYIDLSQINTAFELGAHKGYVAMQLAHLGKPEMKIYCFEPEKRNYEYLLDNIKENNLEDRVFAFNLAVSNKDGTLPFYISEHEHGHSLLPEHNNNVKKVDVMCKTIPTLMKEYKLNKLDLLKIDIEGAEYDVMFNLDRNVLEKIDYIMAEAHITTEHTIEDMIEFLKDNGYEYSIPYSFETSILARKKN